MDSYDGRDGGPTGTRDPRWSRSEGVQQLDGCRAAPYFFALPPHAARSRRSELGHARCFSQSIQSLEQSKRELDGTGRPGQVGDSYCDQHLPGPVAFESMENLAAPAGRRRRGIDPPDDCRREAGRGDTSLRKRNPAKTGSGPLEVIGAAAGGFLFAAL